MVAELEAAGLTWWTYGLTDGLWFDGYEGEDVVLLDEYRSQVIPFHQLLRILDTFQVTVPYKGGMVNFIPKVIIVTTCYDPIKTFTFTDHAAGTTHVNENIAQLLRRISVSAPANVVYDQYAGYHWRPEAGRTTGIQQLQYDFIQQQPVE